MRYRNEVLGDYSGSVRAQGWSYGIAEHLNTHGFLFCVDAHRDGKRFIVARTSPRITPLNLGTKVSSVGASLLCSSKISMVTKWRSRLFPSLFIRSRQK